MEEERSIQLWQKRGGLFQIMALLIIFNTNASASLYFEPALLGGENIADLSYFERGGMQIPGEYQVDIYLNGSPLGSDTLHFAARNNLDNTHETIIKDNTGLQPCLTRQIIDEMNINIRAFPKAMTAGESCIALGAFIPQAYTSFDFQRMRLDISIPQVALNHTPRGWISPEKWDHGINAAQLSYRFNGRENRGRNGRELSHYLNLNGGLNLGAWRLRDNRTWNHYKNDHRTRQSWEHISTYVERAIIPWRSALTIGDASTNSDVFDALSFRGIQLASDDSMYPDTLRGFAPTVKGIAGSNAQISIHQNNHLVYRTFVAPGAFEINDLYPASNGGDLDVTVTEADGSSRTFTVPYSSVPVLRRDGSLRYSAMVGRYRSRGSDYSEPAFTQGTLLWGLPHNLTVYGGGQISENYLSAALGAGMNFGGWGALSADITGANSTLADNSRYQGYSLRFLYSRSLVATGTTFQLAGYRYSTRGFHTLDETALKRTSGWLHNNDAVGNDDGQLQYSYRDYYNLGNSKRSRWQANISQRFGNFGSLYLTGSRQSYWNNSNTTNAFQAGFSSSLGRVNYSLSHGFSRASGQPKADRSFSLSVTLPLDAWLSPSDNFARNWASYNANRNADGNIIHQAGLNGTLLHDNNLSWSLSQGRERQGVNSGNASLNYQGSQGVGSLGYSYSEGWRQTNYGVAGSAVVHADGLTLGQPLGISNVLVAAPGAAGVPIVNGTGVHTDRRGYTLVPYASNYRENRVSLDISQLDYLTEIERTAIRVIPTRGALVRAEFKTQRGIRALMMLTHKGRSLPFGTVVSSGENSGLVDEEGQVYIPGLPLEGAIKAQWGKQENQQCLFSYRFPESALQEPVSRLEGECQ